MKIKIHSAEINRMMKTISQCIDPRFADRGNIEIKYENNLLTIRGTNGQVSAIVSTPMLGGDGEVFCVDGTMFAKVCAMCNGEIEISTDEKNCYVKGAGRTRIPLVNGNVPSHTSVEGKMIVISSDELTKCYKGVSYAISEDQGRIQLTGVLTETNNNELKMVSLDGFQMSTESAQCDGENIHIIIPGSFMKLVVQGTITGEDVKIVTDGSRVEAITDSMTLASGLLAGEYPDYVRILPTVFSTESIVKVEELKNALKCCSVISSTKNLVKLIISETNIKVMSNSENADYEADVACDTHGNELKIAFDQKYLMNTINAINAEEVILKFNSSVSPCIAQGKDSDGIRLLLPVRIAG
jgi:DNA polymerase-3 subunit beta